MLVSRWSLPRAPDRQWIAGASARGRCHGAHGAMAMGDTRVVL